MYFCKKKLYFDLLRHDCCIFSKDKEKIYALLKNLSKTFKLTDEGGVKSYLGIIIIIIIIIIITNIKGSVPV